MFTEDKLSLKQGKKSQEFINNFFRKSTISLSEVFLRRRRKKSLIQQKKKVFENFFSVNDREN